MTPRAIVLDTETTGFTDPEVMELAWCEWPGGDATFCEHYCPSKMPEWGAVSTHHIFMQDVAGAPPSAEARMPEGYDYLIGHGVDYDWGVLGQPPIRRICTLALSRNLWPQLDSHKLGAMYYFLFGMTLESRGVVQRAHSALDDVNMTTRILGELIIRGNLSTNLDALWAASEEARIPRVMSFGKYKGEPISKVDRGYAGWYAKQPDPDHYVLEAFRRQGLVR